MLKILKNYYQISEMLHTSAQPEIDQFSIIKNNNIEIIIADYGYNYINLAQPLKLIQKKKI